MYWTYKYQSPNFNNSLCAVMGTLPVHTALLHCTLVHTVVSFSHIKLTQKQRATLKTENKLRNNRDKAYFVWHYTTILGTVAQVQNPDPNKNGQPSTNAPCKITHLILIILQSRNCYSHLIDESIFTESLTEEKTFIPYLMNEPKCFLLQYPSNLFQHHTLNHLRH